jgi:uncharacterized membrane protein
MVDEHKTNGKPGRLWRVVLVCSLALNLAIVGLVVGMLASGRLGDKPPRSFDLGLGPIARALTPDERREIGRDLRQDGALRDFDLRARAQRIIAALQADPFDREVLRVLLDEQNVRVTDVQGKAHKAFLDQITQMTPERRAEFADQLAGELSKPRPPRDRSSGG